jgi:hypothetical protein
LVTDTFRDKWLLETSRRRSEVDHTTSGSPTSDIAPWDSSSTLNNIAATASSSSAEQIAGIRTRRAALAEDDNPRANAAVNSLAYKDKLEAKWLENVLNEQDDDEEYADGNAVQHLYSAVAVHFGGSYHDKSPKAGRKDSSAIDLPPAMTEEIWVRMCQWHPQLNHLDQAKRELFNTALVAWNTVVMQKAEPVRTISPLLFSLLLQEAAVRKGVEPNYLVRELLWRQCHWDFPAGRQLLRQLKKVFDVYARAGTLNQAGFLRLAQEVGLARDDDQRTGVRERLARAFAEQMKSTAPAPFVEFVRLLEYVSTFIRVKGVEGTWPILQKVADAHKHIT